MLRIEDVASFEVLYHQMISSLTGSLRRMISLRKFKHSLISFSFLHFAFWMFIRTFLIPVNFVMFALLFQYKKVCHEFQLDPTLHFATYWRIYLFLDLNLSSVTTSWRLIMSPNEEYLFYSLFTVLISLPFHNTYFTPYSQYLFYSCHKMFRLRHFYHHFFINISKLVLFPACIQFPIHGILCCSFRAC